MRALYTKASISVPKSFKQPKYCHHSLSPLRPPFLSSLPTPRFPSLQISRPPPQTQRRSLTRASMASSQSSGTGQGAEEPTKPFSVLFVCLGNICRSPAAEGVFTDLVNKKGLDSNFNIDSAGTINYHEGNQADPRMRAAAKKRGIAITSISRPIKPSDFKDFDLILAMDEQNKDDILRAFEKWSRREALPADAHEKVLDLLEDACDSLLDTILAQKGQK